MAGTKRWNRIPWKSGLFLLAAIAVVELPPAPVPAQQPPAAAASVPRFDMAVAAETDVPRHARPRRAAPPPAAAPAAPAERVAAPDYPIRAELPVGRRLAPGEWAWTDGSFPDAGEALIVVNLRAQLLSLYKGGYEIGRARIIYGADEKPTPTGTFPILEKDAVHFSNLYGGAPMPFMLRLTRDGVAIHGSQMAADLVTHGCVGIPRDFAARLFREVDVGDRVVVWRG